MIGNYKWLGFYRYSYTPVDSFQYHAWLHLPLLYKNWASGEPNNWSGSQNCVRLYHYPAAPAYQDTQWDYTECTGGGNYYDIICESGIRTLLMKIIIK